MEFNIPTKLVYLEEEKELTIGNILKENRFNNILFLYGRHSLKNSGYYSLIIDSLNKNGIKYTEFNDIDPNPDTEKAREIMNIVKQNNFDCILAVGGGSVLDMAKYISNNYYYSGDITDLMMGKFKPINNLPLVTMITIIGSGSEMSNSCVMSNKQKHIKQGYRSQLNYPFISYLNPYLTKTCSNYNISVGIADMFCHTLERYFSSSQTNVCDKLSLALLKEIVEVSYEVVNKEFDINSRKKMMLCSTLAHCGITSFMENYSMPIHKVEHILTGNYDSLTHGEGISIIMKNFVILNKNKLKDKILKLVNTSFNVKTKSINKAINIFVSWVNSLNLHQDFSFIGVDEKEIKNLYKKYLLIK